MSNRPASRAAGQVTPANERLGDFGSMLKVMGPLCNGNGDPTHRKRQLVADMCRLIGDRLVDPTPHEASANGLSPRMEQTLRWLLDGDSEKQVAAKLRLSPHTVHVYVKGIYKRYGVSSRAELLAKWVKQ
jgi:DNA-binding CsgD family transcriptional regulator